MTKTDSKDLAIKIGTKAEVLWTKVKEESESLIKQSEDNLIIQRAMLQLAEDNIKAEQSK